MSKRSSTWPGRSTPKLKSAAAVDHFDHYLPLLDELVVMRSIPPALCCTALVRLAARCA
ncbi:MAG: hypothetical protein U0892_05115 [Pirellulales bacterium]